MSRLVLGLFALVTGLAIATADYVNESRKLGFGIGEVSAEDYVALLKVRFLPETSGISTLTVAKADGPDDAPALFEDVALFDDAATGSVRDGAGLSGLISVLSDVAQDGVGALVPGLDGTIDMEAFDATRKAIRVGAPSGEVTFTKVGDNRLSSGDCLDSGVFKRCRVSR